MPLRRDLGEGWWNRSVPSTSDKSRYVLAASKRLLLLVDAYHLQRHPRPLLAPNAPFRRNPSPCPLHALCTPSARPLRALRAPSARPLRALRAPSAHPWCIL